MIILQVVLAPQSAPPSPGELHGQSRRALDKTATGAGQETHRVLFQAGPAENPALSLLLTNHQLHAETLDTVRRAFAETTPSYTTDIVYLKDQTLWPTWLSVPLRASHVDTVHAQFRIFDCPDDLRLKEPPRGMFSGGCGGPPPISWPFYHLLVGSIVSGSHGPCGLPFTMKRLVLDFPPATEDDLLPLGRVVETRWSHSPDEIWEEVFDYFSLDDAFNAQCLDNPRLEPAARLIRFVHNMLEFLARLTSDGFFYGRYLHENIGIIELRLDGEVYKTLDLGYHLANVRRWGSDSESFSRRQWYGNFLPWESGVKARRRELGMPAQGQ